MIDPIWQVMPRIALRLFRRAISFNLNLKCMDLRIVVWSVDYLAET